MVSLVMELPASAAVVTAPHGRAGTVAEGESCTPLSTDEPDTPSFTQGPSPLKLGYAELDAEGESCTPLSTDEPDTPSFTQAGSPPLPLPPAGPYAQLMVVTLTGRTITIDAAARATVKDLQDQIAEKTSIPPEMQRLLLHGRQPRDDAAVADLGLRAGDTLRLSARLAGGSKRKKRSPPQGEWPLPQQTPRAKAARPSPASSSVASSAGAAQLAAKDKEIKKLRALLATQATAATAPAAVPPPAPLPPRPRTVALETAEEEVDVFPEAYTDPVTLPTSPLMLAASTSEVPAMIEAPLTAAERDHLAGQLSAAEAAHEALKPVAGLEAECTRIATHIQCLRRRLHRAKPLSERRVALAAAAERRAAHFEKSAREVAEAETAPCRREGASCRGGGRRQAADRGARQARPSHSSGASG